jgi:uncharacterized protein (TIGR03435 family)
MRTALLLLATCAFAQPPSLSQQPSFEAATIKPSKSQPGRSATHSRPGMVVLTGKTLKGLICSAYDVKDFQVSGGPKWLDDDRYDINAKAEGATTGAQRMMMLQTLLADRFQLVIHREQKIGPAYALVLVKSGLKIKPAEGVTGTNAHGGKGQLTVTGMPMTELADLLSRELKAPVVDFTATPGVFDFKLEWSIEGDSNDAQSALFAALQSQLGLKLESRKLPVEMIVVDRAEKPSEN